MKVQHILADLTESTGFIVAKQPTRWGSYGLHMTLEFLITAVALWPPDHSGLATLSRLALHLHVSKSDVVILLSLTQCAFEKWEGEIKMSVFCWMQRIDSSQHTFLGKVWWLCVFPWWENFTAKLCRISRVYVAANEWMGDQPTCRQSWLYWRVAGRAISLIRPKFVLCEAWIPTVEVFWPLVIVLM